MTEEWWRQYKDNKQKSENKIFTDIESELKRRFKSEKKPEEMYSMCLTDNNYWKHYRWSENLDPDAVSLVLCKDVGCDLMYCQALTMQGKDEMYGCVEQYQNFRDCYIKEKRKFFGKNKESDWLLNRNLIPEYIDQELTIRKEQKEKDKLFGEIKVIKVDESKLRSVPKSKVEMTEKEGYF
jgi:hypothetical protein